MSVRITLIVREGERTSLQPGDIIEWIDWGGGWRIRRPKDGGDVPVLFLEEASGEHKLSFMVHQTRTLQLEPIAALFAAMAGLNIEAIDNRSWRCVAPSQ